MTIIALDLSLSCVGVAVFEDTGNGEVFPLSVESISTKGIKGGHPEKLVFIANRLSRLREKYDPSIIAYERGFSRFNNSTQAIFMVVGIMKYTYCGIEQVSYPPSTIKKSIAGKGNVKKDVLRDAVLEMYPEVIFANTDESDAFAVGLHHIKIVKEGNDGAQNL